MGAKAGPAWKATALATLVLAATGALADVPPGAPGVTLREVEANGITIRVAEQGEGPLALMLHGFPESWYSWRHQLGFLAGTGYRAVAPDMRGYGGTDAPEAIEAYDVLTLCGDVTGLMDALGEERAVLLGHDWGAVVAWVCALEKPERFSALVAMSVPWGPRPPEPTLVTLRRAFGENFFYMLYFQQPGVAEAELDGDPRGLLSRFLTSPDTPREPPEITDPRASAGGLIGRMGKPRELPPWLSEADLDYFVAEMSRKGFRGGLNYYRNIDRSWELTPHLEGRRIEVPVLFIAGRQDIVLAGRAREQIEGPMRQVAADLRGVHLIPGAGHWIQQERPHEVNGRIAAFLATLGGTGSGVADGPHPAAPPETAQFAFLVGEWDCATKFMKPDGSGFNEGRARWSGEWILLGWAIQDHWIGYGPDGQEFHGTNIRSFNPETGRWDNRWLAQGSLQWKYFWAARVGETMVMTGGEGADPRGAFVDRNTFYEIGADSWRWRKDRSWDGGASWLEGIGFIECRAR